MVRVEDVANGALAQVGSRANILLVARWVNERYREMVAKVTELLQRQQTVTLAQVRDLLGTSRRYVQALLERMDDDRITVRRGDERVLRSPGGPTA